MEGERKDDTCNQTAQKAVQENQPENQEVNSRGNNPPVPPGASAGSSWGWRDLIVGVTAGTAAVVATPMVLSAAGFTASGIAAGSVAATIQSVWYGGTAGGMFAALQSAGVLGIGSTATAAIGGATGAAAVMIRRVGRRLYSSGEVSEPGNNQDQEENPEPDDNTKKGN